MKFLRYHIILAFSWAILFPPSAVATSPYTTTQITAGNYLPESPQINNNGQVVWSGSDGEHYNIYLCKNGVVTQITNNGFDNREPQINDNGQIAWKGYTTGSCNTIFFYNAGQITQINNSLYNNITFQLNSTGQIAWSANYQDDYKIYLYTNETTTQITHNTNDDKNPKLNSKGQIVWESYNGSNYELCLYSNGNITQITNNGKNNLNPAINDNGQVVWEMVDGLNSNIMFYDGTSIINLTYNNYYNKNPQINNNGQITWESYRDGAVDLYAYSNSITQQIITGRPYNLSPKINDNGEIVWLGHDGVNMGIYRYANGTVSQITNLRNASIAQQVFYNSGANDLNAGTILSKRFNSGMQINNVNNFKSSSSTTGGIQEAINALPLQGGVVYIPAGTYILKSCINLLFRNNVHLIGDGSSTILKPVNETKSKLYQDANYGDSTIVLEDSTGFEVGMDIIIQDDSTWGEWNGQFSRITAINGNALTISNPIFYASGYLVSNNAIAVNAFPVILNQYNDSVSIENILIDGNKQNVNDYSIFQAGILSLHSTNTLIRNNCIINSNRDGISDQSGGGNGNESWSNITNNSIFNSSNIGIHLGSIDKFIRVANNKVINNGNDGIYFCIGVQYCNIYHNLISGSVGNGIGGIDNSGNIGDRYNSLMDNVVNDNSLLGINTNSIDFNIIAHNIIFNNSQLTSQFCGLYLGDINNFIVKHNILFDDQIQHSQNNDMIYIGNGYENYIAKNIIGNNDNITPLGLYDLVADNLYRPIPYNLDLIILSGIGHYLSHPQINNNGQIVYYDSNGSFLNLFLLNTVPTPGSKYVISASSGTGGGTSPSGSVYAKNGSSPTFAITPDPGYQVADVSVDGISQGPLASYTFTNVQANHSLTASFRPAAFTVTASAGAGGTIDPSGAVILNNAASQSFSIIPYPNYHVAAVQVDGASVGPVTSYTFTAVNSDHSIAASFAINTQTIQATSGGHGIIAPSGNVTVNHGAAQTFSFTPDSGYHVADVQVDGISMGAAGTYAFDYVSSDHSITVSFAINTYTLTPSAGAHGTISPAAAVSVNFGDSLTFSITPDTNYKIQEVLVDGVSVGAAASYTFTNVADDHSITASFMSNIPILTDKDPVRLPRGGTASLRIKLGAAPPTSVTLNVAWGSGNPAIYLTSGASLTFDSSNWNSYQTVQFLSSADGNNFGAAVFSLSGPGLASRQVTVTNWAAMNIPVLLQFLGLDL